MAARKFWTAEYLGQRTTNSGDGADMASLAITDLEANSKYLFIGSSVVNSSNSSSGTGIVSHYGSWDGASFNNRRIRHYRPRNAVSWRTNHALGVIETGESPPDSISMWNYFYSVGRVEVSQKDSRIVGIKLTENDKYAQTLGDDAITITSTTYVDLLTLTFTPPTPGDYLIIAGNEQWRAITTSPGYTRLLVNSTPRLEATIGTSWDKVNRNIYFAIHKETFSASPQTIKLQQRGGSSSATYSRHPAIVVLRLSDFDDYYYASDDVRSTTTSTTMQEKLSLDSISLDGSSWLLLSSAICDVSLTSQYRETAIRIGGTNYLLDIDCPDSTYSFPGLPSFGSAFKLSSITSDKPNLAYRSSNSSATAGIANARIVALQLSPASASLGNPHWYYSMLNRRRH